MSTLLRMCFSITLGVSLLNCGQSENQDDMTNERLLFSGGTMDNDPTSRVQPNSNTGSQSRDMSVPRDPIASGPPDMVDSQAMGGLPSAMMPPSEQPGSSGGSDAMDEMGQTDAMSEPTTPENIPLIDMNCIDGQYTEPLPDPMLNISDLLETYQPNTGDALITSIMERRYPLGARLIALGKQGRLGDCVAPFLGNQQGTVQSVLGRLSTVVHECGHFADLGMPSFGTNTYIINLEKTVTCSGADTTSRGGETFARSRINGDEFAVPACRRSGADCDTYRDVYLDGNPDDDQFEGGDQGFNSVLEETLQYINSLASGFATHPEALMAGQRKSERDGILTFLWYTVRYLRMARLQYPDAYTHIRDDSCIRDLVLTLWGRAWLYLELTEDIVSLGINDAAIEARLLNPLFLQEINALRIASGCAQ